MNSSTKGARPTAKQDAPGKTLPGTPSTLAARKSTRLNTTIGISEISAWQPSRGTIWIQTRLPQFARKLSQRRDCRLVVRGVSGGYLRTYEFHRDIAWAGRLIRRYTLGVIATNAAVIAPNPAVQRN
jgi:hypothetical protein